MEGLPIFIMRYPLVIFLIFFLMGSSEIGWAEDVENLVIRWQEGKIPSQSLQDKLGQLLTNANDKDFLTTVIFLFSQQDGQLNEMVFDEIAINHYARFSDYMIKANLSQQVFFLNAFLLLPSPSEQWQHLYSQVWTVVEEKLTHLFTKWSCEELLPNLNLSLSFYGIQIHEPVLNILSKTQSARVEIAYATADKETKYKFLNLLRGVKHPHFLTLVIKALSEQDTSLQVLSIQIVRIWKGQLENYDHEIQSILLSLLEKEVAKEKIDHYFISQICLTLGHLQSDLAIPCFLKILKTGQGQSKSIAVWALRHITGLHLSADSSQWELWWESENKKYQEILLSTPSPLGSSNINQCYAAIRAVGEFKIRKREATEYLLPLLQHKNAFIRKEVCIALRNLRQPIAISYLILILEDQDVAVRHEAWQSLKLITGQDIPITPEDWQVWYYNNSLK